MYVKGRVLVLRYQAGKDCVHSYSIRELREVKDFSGSPSAVARGDLLNLNDLDHHAT